jgi:hypothetical protein
MRAPPQHRPTAVAVPQLTALLQVVLFNPFTPVEYQGTSMPGLEPAQRLTSMEGSQPILKLQMTVYKQFTHAHAGLRDGT